MKKFQIFIMLISLVLLLVPRQYLYAQDLKKGDCCTTTSSIKKCCKEHSPKTDSNKKDGTDCHNCTSCVLHFGQNVLYNKEEPNNLFTPIYVLKKVAFKYAPPHYSFTFNDIWQPPKIG